MFIEGSNAFGGPVTKLIVCEANVDLVVEDVFSFGDDTHTQVIIHLRKLMCRVFCVCV